MRLLQDHPGWNYHTDDPAKLFIAHSGEFAEPPASFKGRLLHRHLNGAGSVPIRVENLEFLCAGMFGAGRPSGSGPTKWTGDSYKYAVYRYERQIVILRTDGGGFYAYIDNSIDAIDYWERLAFVLPTETIWNLCHTMAHAFQTGTSNGRQEIIGELQAGSLKLRKRTKGGVASLRVVAA